MPMSHVSADASPEAEKEAADDAGVRARLAKEVADWSAERSGRVRVDAVDLAPAEVKPAPRPTKPAKRAAKPAQPKLASAPSKPFSMSYDGVTSREYMDQVIARGTR
jgi:hypothetical protein